MASLEGIVVCAHCWVGSGTLVSAAGGVLVHHKCREIYEISHPMPSVKSKAMRRQKRESRRAARR
jgi:hypothetical protein